MYRGLKRAQAAALTQLRTGHIALNHYLHRINAVDTALCVRCGEPETVDHFLLRCSRFLAPRQVLRGQLKGQVLSSRSLLGSQKNLSALMSYVEQTGRLTQATHTSQTQSPHPRAPSVTPPPTPPRSPTPSPLPSYASSVRGSASPTHPASQTADYGEQSSLHASLRSLSPTSSSSSPGSAQPLQAQPTSYESADYGERSPLHSHDPDSSFYSVNSYDFFAPSFSST